MSTSLTKSLCKLLAPEDIRVGDYVAVTEVIVEFPSFFWCADRALTPAHELVRIGFLPEDESEALRVRAVCLPFVFAECPHRMLFTLDVRRQRVVRLSKAYGRCVWKAVKQQRQRERKRSKKRGN